MNTKTKHKLVIGVLGLAAMAGVSLQYIAKSGTQQLTRSFTACGDLIHKGGEGCKLKIALDVPGAFIADSIDGTISMHWEYPGMLPFSGTPGKTAVFIALWRPGSYTHYDALWDIRRRYAESPSALIRAPAVHGLTQYHRRPPNPALNYNFYVLPNSEGYFACNH
jgi:hypothetical protein